MSKPCGAQLGGISTGKEFGLLDGYGRRSGVGNIRFSIESTPRRQALEQLARDYMRQLTYMSIWPTFLKLISCHELPGKTEGQCRQQAMRGLRGTNSLPGVPEARLGVMALLRGILRCWPGRRGGHRQRVENARRGRAHSANRRIRAPVTCLTTNPGTMQ